MSQIGYFLKSNIWGKRKMTENKLELGIVGLGKMGGSIALHCLEKGIKSIGNSEDYLTNIIFN